VDGQPLEVVDLQQTLDQLPALLGGVAVDVLEAAALDLLEEVGLALRAEGVVALQHHVEEDAQRPHVRVDRTVVHLRHDLRSHVGGRPAEGVDGPVSLAPQTEAEVDQLQLPVSVYQNVLRFYIAVDDVQVVQVLQRLRDHQQKLLGLCLGQAVFGLGEQVVVEGVGSPVLEDEVELSLRLDDVDELGDGGVGELGEDVDLPLQVLNLVGLIHALLFVDLHCDLLVVALVEPHADRAVCALPQFSEDLVVAHFLLGLDGHDEVEQLGAPALLLVGGVLELLHLELADVVGRELVLHEVVHELHVHLLGALVLLLQRLLRTLGVGGGAVAHLPDDLPRSRVPLLALLQLLQDVIIRALVVALGVYRPVARTAFPLLLRQQVVLSNHRSLALIRVLLVRHLVL
jgi:hypothetical protein